MYIQEHTQTVLPGMSDAVLAQLVLAGDQDAFEILVRRYNTPLFNFICRFLGDYDLACDVLQQVFLRFYTSLPKLGTGEPFKSWLFQVARNCCVDELRRRHRYAIRFSQLEIDNVDGELPGLADIPDPGRWPAKLVGGVDLNTLRMNVIKYV